ncbi:uncharacterized protein LOC131937250 [Physella acuta]|uniref:uncharacterized protein LOC131937250 n=1 Tax=Physella acuta TaxID=109671 RepID=UPI0027DEA79B|nr:uncharacterized protein LOC131937250 [Physella acuta]XP_059150510.1 uncharacterized protein LOC131937250 [Physella acuta]
MLKSKNGFQFSHLEEDFDEDELGEGGGGLDVELQPHLSIANSNNYVPHLDPDSTSSQSAVSENKQKLNQAGQTSGEPKTTTLPDRSGQSKTLPDRSGQLDGSTEDKVQTPNSVDQTLKKELSPVGKQEAPQVTPTNNNTVALSSIQVQYAEGKVVMQDAVATRDDGSRYIDTEGIPYRWSEHERPLRKRRLLLLKIFSLISLALFLPTGILAVYFAFRAEKEFLDGIQQGNIDRAQKFAKRSKNFTIISLVMCIVIVALIITVVSRPYFTDTTRGTLVG